MEKIQKSINLAIDHFFGKNHLAELSVCNTGHINHTYFLRINGGEKSGHYVLQKLNGNIFKNPEQVMENIVKVTSHLKNKYEQKGIDPSRRVLNLVPTIKGDKWFADENNDVWRTYVFIENASTYDVAQSTEKLLENFHHFLVIYLLKNFTKQFRIFTIHQSALNNLNRRWTLRLPSELLWQKMKLILLIPEKI